MVNCGSNTDIDEDLSWTREESKKQINTIKEYLV